MANNYFTQEDSFRHLFFLRGLTADTFYPDGGMRVNIEWLTFLELKKSGYERIVFLDKNQILYVYDDRSFSFLHGAHGVSAISREQLGRTGLDSWDEEEDEIQQAQASATKEPYHHNQEGIGILQMDETPLHLGMMSFEDAWEQVDSYMHDRSVKTAVVIRDASSSFRQDVRQASRLEVQFEHELTVGVQRLDDDNENIMILISGDSDLGSICNRQDPSLEDKNVNLIDICNPNALELKNMLLYFREMRGLRFAMREVDELALALHQAMAMKKNLRIKEVYKRLNRFAKENRVLRPDDCYALCSVKKPMRAKEQLDQLIGMKSVKERLLSYDIGVVEHASVLEGLSASRLAPDQKMQSQIRSNQMIHFVLTGNPGTGKTTVAKIIGQLFYEMGYLADGHLVETDRSQLVGEYVGHTAVKTRNKVLEALGGVLFVDEAYSLVRDKDSKGDFGFEAVEELVKCMDEFKGQFILVAAGYEDRMKTFLESNQGLASRFGSNHIHIDDYTSDEMNQILHWKAKQAGYVFSREWEEKMPDFCENWVNLSDESWGNGREAETLINDLDKKWHRDPHHTSCMKDGKTYGVLETSYLSEEQKELLVPVSQTREEVLDHLRRMTGLQEVKKRIEDIRNVLLVSQNAAIRPMHYRFEGNPGTGKTTVARYMGMILRNLEMLKRGRLVEYSATSLMQEIRQKNISFEEIAQKALGDVLFIDEAYQLVNYDVGRTVLDSLLPYMENHAGEICVILAGYPDDMEKLMEYNEGFKSRFDTPIVFENYQPEELYEILLKMVQKQGYTTDEAFRQNARRILHAYIPRIASKKEFGNARYIRDTFIPDCISAQSNRLIQEYGEDRIPDEMRKQLTGDDFAQDLLGFRNIPLKEKKTKSAMEVMEELVGFEDVKEKLQMLMRLKQRADEENHPALLDRQNLHWVLKGNPGTGKTTVASLVGQVYREIGLLPKGHVVTAKRQDLVGGYVGHTEEKTQKLIDQAMGGVLFIDEAYTLSQGNSSGNDYGQRAIDVLLEQMSTHAGEFALIAAGYPKEMDGFLASNPGLKGRFSKEFNLEDYTGEQVTRIFEIKCKEQEMPMEESLPAVLTTLFERMRQSKGKEWINGREAENLFNAMKEQWAMDEERVSVLMERHIPQSYRKYLENNDVQRTAGNVFDVNASTDAYPIAENRMAEPYASFDYQNRQYRRQKEALVFIESTLQGNKASGTGSIITKDGCILTCCHVIKGAEALRVRLRTMEYGIEKNVWKDARVVWFDEEMDAAILQMESGEYPTLPLQPMDAEVVEGEKIYHWGFPFGKKLSNNENDLNPSLFEGSVSSIQIKGAYERIYVDMGAKRGCSGGPVLSQSQGCIIGILCGSQTQGDDRLMEEMNYILPMSAIWEVIYDMDGGE